MGTCLIFLPWIANAQPTQVKPGDGDDRSARDQSTDPDRSTTEDEGLAERLIRDFATGADEDVMAGITRLMQDSARKLDAEFDAGTETQAVQRQIIEKLGQAINAAAAQRRLRRQNQPSSSSDKRRTPKQKPGRPDEQPTASSQPTGASAGESTAPSVVRREDAAAANLKELRRAWGNLPMREREEVIQGIGESSLERYRAWIERYYRALQDIEE